MPYTMGHEGRKQGGVVGRKKKKEKRKKDRQTGQQKMQLEVWGKQA